MQIVSTLNGFPAYKKQAVRRFVFANKGTYNKVFTGGGGSEPSYSLKNFKVALNPLRIIFF